MFRNRQSSQKPPDELFERFRQSFPNVINTTAPNGQSEVAVAEELQDATFNQPRQVADLRRCFGEGLAQFTGHEDLDPTPRAPGEPFRFTPSLTPSVFMDPTSAAFAAFANQPPGLFTPTPGANTSSSFSATNGIPATHDLQTPNISIGVGTPLSMPNGITLPVPQTIQPHQFHDYQPFPQHLQQQYLDPSQFEQHTSSGPGSPMDITGSGGMISDTMTMNDSMNGITPMVPLAPPVPLDENQFDHIAQLLPSSERFRFHVVLNAPTAMIKHPEEIPVTYLNKGQAYAISIADTQPPVPDTSPVMYRTFIRISFHDETQRNRPAGCWQLWKEGRGTNEAHQRGGKLQAVEYAENQANGNDDKKKKAKVSLESSSFDGFSIVWSPTVSGAAETTVSVRFNFLSTDFSHSKGVKGIPVRLCAKSEVISTESPRQHPPESSPEVCYCKVKLFRDHGAERKLSNDIMHVKKTIEKLKQQASQVEGTGMKIFGKKAKKEDDLGKPGKVPKHKRTWSMSSASSVVGSRPQEEDTNAKLQSMRDMFSSTRPVSVLYLRGDDSDDPDLHPVRLPGDPDGEDTWAYHRRASVATTNTTVSSFVSPTPSSASLSSRRGDSFSPEKDWKNEYQSLPRISRGDVPVTVKTNEDGMLSGWIEAIGIDTSYKPPVENLPKAVMCIYILPVFLDQPEDDVYYRAVYMQSRTASCLSSSIASKCGMDPATVFRTVQVDSRGLKIFIDDDFVSQMKEGQDMKIQLKEIVEDSVFSSPPQEWSNTGGNHVEINGGKKWELRLIY